ncbi:MFS general substrate transporter [Linderina pennispora]|uniref:MFS general substrate transporter n=1 Tax=Linderina pennispora TaxID=61395 RepID=A0A1Y1VVB2_9FUNG|nr:MFS general substrate transporter [Linderina pennispora]ORX65227.1 MFS general substrate transporter [Linderina pennispora]
MSKTNDSVAIEEGEIVASPAQARHPLVPYMALLYMFNALDRGNIGNARLGGLEEGTHLTGNDFYNALSFFYFGYCISQVPNMFLLKKVSPSVLIGVTMVLGAYSGLVAARFFMGIFEAGIGPGAPIILSFFYLRNELAWRTAMFYGSSTIAGAFGGAIAYGVAKNLAHEKLAPWQVSDDCAGLVTIFFLPNSPHKLEKWFVTPEEKQRQLIAAFKDYKNLFTCLIYIGLNIPLASYTSFLPTIVKNMGYSDAKAQLMTVPPYACALVTVLLFAWNSDRTQRRGYHVAGAASITCLGYILLISSGNCTPTTPVPALLPWVSNNNVGHTKRAISVALLNTFGQCFATVGTQIYKTKTAPRFFMGYGYAEFGEPKPLSPEEQAEAVQNGIYDDHPSFRFYI